MQQTVVESRQTYVLPAERIVKATMVSEDIPAEGDISSLFNLYFGEAAMQYQMRVTKDTGNVTVEVVLHKQSAGTIDMSAKVMDSKGNPAGEVSVLQTYREEDGRKAKVEAFSSAVRQMVKTIAEMKEKTYGHE